MGTSNKKSIKFVQYKDDGSTGAIDFDWGAIGDSPVFEGAWGECLKDAVNNYLKRKIIQMFMVFESMTPEERQTFIGKEGYNMSFRALGRQIQKDHKTAQNYYHKAMFTIKNSPLVKVEFEHKNRGTQK